MQNLKTLILSFCLLLNIVFAQVPVLTSALNPTVGDNYEGFKVDTNAIDLSIVGTDQSWTIPATSILVGSFSTFTAKTVSATPYASTFSGSSLGVLDSQQDSYTFFTTSATQLELDGYGDLYGTTYFSNPATLITFPFTYTNTVSDNLAGTADVGFEFTVSGTSNTIADAYGTLTLPSGTYNVLRVKITQSATSSNTGGSITTDITTYYWYSELHKYPLLEVDITKTVGTGIFNPSASSYEKRAFIITPELLNINNNTLLNHFSFYPNPAGEKSNLSFSIDKPANISVSMINALGQESHLISSKQATTGLHKEIVDISNLPKGIYTIRLSINETISQQKIIIQ